MYIDCEHAGNKKKRRSRTGIMVSNNTALTSWFSKKQLTAEMAQQGIDVQGIRCKLRMIRVLLSSPIYSYDNNMSIIHNTTEPVCNCICYHSVVKSVTMKESFTGHVTSKEQGEYCEPYDKEDLWSEVMLLDFLS